MSWPSSYVSSASCAFTAKAKSLRLADSFRQTFGPWGVLTGDWVSADVVPGTLEGASHGQRVAVAPLFADAGRPLTH